ncbi:MAG: polysaccharide deacetylase family protein [Candidatus Wallbacteria bacterium]
MNDFMLFTYFKKTAKLVYRVSLGIVDTPAIVLLYHRINKLDNDRQLLSVTPENFYEQINYLKKRYNILDIDEFIYHIENNIKFHPKSLIITFDDGYADNYIYGLPVLKDLKIQALFFISSANIDTNNEFWWDFIETIYDSCDINILREVLIESKIICDGKINNTEIYNYLHYFFKFKKANERDSIIAEISRKLNYKPKFQNRCLSKRELLNFSKSKYAVIGSHTHNHAPLSVYNFEEQLNEIKMSNNEIENIIKKPIKYFSYPFGMPALDYNETSIDLCKEIGFKAVFSNFYFQVHKWTDRYQIPRMLVRNWEFSEFQKYINKFFNF